MLSVAELSGGWLIAIDGKRICSSYNRGDRQLPIHTVNAFASENNFLLRQVKTQSKSNEILAITALCYGSRKLADTFPEWQGLKSIGVTLSCKEQPSLVARCVDVGG